LLLSLLLLRFVRFAGAFLFVVVDFRVDCPLAGLLVERAGFVVRLVPVDLVRVDVDFVLRLLPDDLLRDVVFAVVEFSVVVDDSVDRLLEEDFLREDAADFLRLLVALVVFSLANGRTISWGAVRLVI
jgi:hypothetical protein